MFDFVKQAYLLGTRFAETVVEGAEELDPHTREKARFYVKQIAGALSPSNFVATNPELLRETLAQNGENLVREAETKRDETLQQLENERTLLERKIDELRNFEREYRSRLKSYLEGLLTDVDSRGNVSAAMGDN